MAGCLPNFKERNPIASQKNPQKYDGPIPTVGSGVNEKMAASTASNPITWRKHPAGFVRCIAASPLPKGDGTVIQRERRRNRG